MGDYQYDYEYPLYDEEDLDDTDDGQEDYTTWFDMYDDIQTIHEKDVAIEVCF